MLVLTRKHGQQIVINDDIVVSVVKIQGNTVRIGIDAPEHVRILRSELAEWNELSFEGAHSNEEEMVAY